MNIAPVALFERAMDYVGVAALMGVSLAAAVATALLGV